MLVARLRQMAEYPHRLLVVTAALSQVKSPYAAPGRLHHGKVPGLRNDRSAVRHCCPGATVCSSEPTSDSSRDRRSLHCPVLHLELLLQTFDLLRLHQDLGTLRFDLRPLTFKHVEPRTGARTAPSDRLPLLHKSANDIGCRGSISDQRQAGYDLIRAFHQQQRLPDLLGRIRSGRSAAAHHGTRIFTRDVASDAARDGGTLPNDCVR